VSFELVGLGQTLNFSTFKMCELQLLGYLTKKIIEKGEILLIILALIQNHLGWPLSSGLGP